MTEQEWLVSTDPAAMLEYLHICPHHYEDRANGDRLHVFDCPEPETGHHAPHCPHQNNTVRRLAQSAYDSRDWSALPILADALEEAGCDNVDILNHLRGKERCPSCRGMGKLDAGHRREPIQCRVCAGTGWAKLAEPLHARGCWCLDLLLGKG